MSNSELVRVLKELEKSATFDWEIERKYPRNFETAYTAVSSLHADVFRVIFDTSNADDNLIETEDDEDTRLYYETGHDADLNLAVTLRNHLPQIIAALEERS